MWLKWLDVTCSFKEGFTHVDERFQIGEVNFKEGLRSFHFWLENREKAHKSKTVKTDFKCRVVKRIYPNI